MKQFLFLIGVLFLAIACKEIYEVPPRSLVQATLTNDSTQLQMSSIVTYQGMGSDSVWNSVTGIPVFTLPLSTKDMTSFRITLDSKVDTISIIHTSTQKYASMETGFYYEYKLKSIRSTHHRIRSIDITDSLVTTIWHENIKINIRPLPPGSH
jgi:hypothetical protein